MSLGTPGDITSSANGCRLGPLSKVREVMLLLLPLLPVLLLPLPLPLLLLPLPLLLLLLILLPVSATAVAAAAVAAAVAHIHLLSSAHLYYSAGSSQRRFLCEPCIRGDGEPVVTGLRRDRGDGGPVVTENPW